MNAYQVAETSQAVKIPQMNLPWIDSPFFEQLLEQANLEAEMKAQVKHFADWGYLIIDPEIENFDHLADEMIQELSSVYGEERILGEATIYPDRIQDAWAFNEKVKNLATAPKVLSLLRVLYQREPIPFQTLNFSKGTEQATHSDAIHFHSVPARFMCGVWVALEDIDLYNGPLHYYPGSHKLPLIDFHDLGINGSAQDWYEYYHVYADFVKNLVTLKQLEKVNISVKKGQALIWAANLLHGGSPILDPTRSRHSQVTHYYFSDCLYYTPLLSDPFLKQIRLRTIKNIITGEVVPQIYNGQTVDLEAEAKTLKEITEQLHHAQEISVELREKLFQSQQRGEPLNTEFLQVKQESEQLKTQLHQSQQLSELLQQQLQHSQEISEQLRRELHQVQTLSKQLKEQLAHSHQESADLRVQFQQTQGALSQAKSMIEAMESSKFWKLRTEWFKVKKRLGLPIT